LGGGSIVLSVLSTSPLPPLIVALSMSALILGLAKIPWRIYSRMLLIPISFALMSCAAVIFIEGSGDAILSFDIMGSAIVVRSDGLELAALLLGRTCGGMCSLFFISLTTPMIEIFSVLRSLRVPQTFLDLAMLIYRQIFVMLDEAFSIRQAQEVRLGNCTLSRSLQSYAMMASVLFLRSWERGERLMVAMDSRCYEGRLDTLEQDSRIDGGQMIMVCCYLLALATIVAMISWH